MQKRFIALSRFASRLRGSVSRDRYHDDMMLSKPFAEIGTRFGKKIVKLAQAHAMVLEESVVGKRTYDLMKKVTLDTISQRYEDVVRTIYLSCPHVNDSIGTRDIAVRTRYTMRTVQRMLSDMNLLEIIEKTGPLNSREWALTPYIHQALEESHLYNGLKPLMRKPRFKRVKKEEGVKEGNTSAKI